MNTAFDQQKQIQTTIPKKISNLLNHPLFAALKLEETFLSASTVFINKSEGANSGASYLFGLDGKI